MKGAIPHAEMAALLRARCRIYGGANELARRAGVTPQYISAALRQPEKPVPKRIAEALGYRPVVVYTPIECEQETDHAGVLADGAAPRKG